MNQSYETTQYALSYFHYIRSRSSFLILVCLLLTTSTFKELTEKKESKSSLRCRFALSLSSLFVAVALLEFTKPPIDPI